MKRLVFAPILALIVTFSAHSDPVGSASSAALGGQSSYPQFKECIAVTSWFMNGKDTASIEKKKHVQIPEGWKVVGTAVFDGDVPMFFICR